MCLNNTFLLPTRFHPSRNKGDTATEWRALLEKELHQAADILEKYGIGSDAKVSELEQHNWSFVEGLGRLRRRKRTRKHIIETLHGRSFAH